MKKLILTTIAIFIFQFLVGQQIAKSSFGNVLLKGGTLVTISNGNMISDLLIKDGLIASIGESLSAEEDVEIIDCEGLYIYPGMIDGGTQLGLAEVGAVSLTQDHDELGDYTPHMEALTAVNPSSVTIPVTRVNGVTTVLTMPTRGLFPGTASLINLHGYTPEQMYAGFKGVILNFPSTGKRNRWDKRTEEDIKKDSEKSMKKLNKYWDEAEIYATIDASGKNDLAYNPQMSAVTNVINDGVPLLIEVNKKGDILNAIKWINEREIKAIFMGVSEGWRLADSLAKYEIPVITGPVLKTPSRASDKYDRPYQNASLMLENGVKVALRTNESENIRNLPYNAGFAATYGMGIEEALKAVTLVPAEIFGVADRYGSLEEGKVASLFISDGDPFETKTEIQYLFIDGWKVPLESRHTLLYDEFLERNPGLDKSKK